MANMAQRTHRSPASPLDTASSAESLDTLKARLQATRPYLDQLTAFYAERRQAEAAHGAALLSIARKFPALGDTAHAPEGFGRLGARLVADTAEAAQAHLSLERHLSQNCERPLRMALSGVRAPDERTYYAQMDQACLRAFRQSALAYQSSTAQVAQHLGAIARVTYASVQALDHPDMELLDDGSPPSVASPSPVGLPPSSPPPKVERSTSTRRRNHAEGLNRAASGNGGLKRVDSVSRGTGTRHRAAANSVSIQLADQPLRPVEFPPASSQGTPSAAASQPLAGQFSDASSSPPAAPGLARGATVPHSKAPRPPQHPPHSNRQDAYAVHARGGSVPTDNQQVLTQVQPTPQAQYPPSSAPAYTGSTDHVVTTSVPDSTFLRRSRSNSSARGSDTEGTPRNPLKSAFSRLGKGKQSSRPPPSQSAGQADAAASAADGPAPLKRSVTLNRLMRRRGPKRSTSSESSRPSSPSKQDDVLDDTLRQIYRAPGTGAGPVEPHQLVTLAQPPENPTQATQAKQGKQGTQLTPAQALARDARRASPPPSSSDLLDSEAAHGGLRRAPSVPRKPLPRPQPIFTEEHRAKQPSQSDAVQRWRSQRRGPQSSNSSGNLLDPGAPKPEPPSPLLGSDSEGERDRLSRSHTLEHAPAPMLNPTQGHRTQGSDGPLAPRDTEYAWPDSPLETPLGAEQALSTFAQQARLSPVQTGPRLQPTIVETLNVLYVGTQVSRIDVVGQVSLSLADYGPSKAQDISANTSTDDLLVPFELQNIPLGYMNPNPAFVQSHRGAFSDGSGYALNVQAVHQALQSHPSVIVCQYTLPSVPHEWAPLELSVQWRPEPSQTSMVLSYALNSRSPLRGLTHIELAAPLEGTITAARSKPTGAWDAGARTIRWLVDPPQVQSYILARFDTTTPVTPQPVMVKWAIQDQTVSGVALDDGPWLPAHRSTVAGKYLVVSA